MGFKPVRFKIEHTNEKDSIGCGALLALFGLILPTPVGVFLVKAVGYISLAAGLILLATGVYYWIAWIARFRRRN